MLGEEIATMRFTDASSGDELWAIVRNMHGCVGLTLSLCEDGDVEACLRPQDCEELVAALQQALSRLSE